MLYSCPLLFSGILILRKELLQDSNTVLRGVAPQDGTERVNGLPSSAVIGAEADIPDMGTEILYDFLHIPQLLRGKERVIQQPVIALPVLVFGTEQVDGGVQKFQHPVAPFNAFGVMFDTAV